MTYTASARWIAARAALFTAALLAASSAAQAGVCEAHFALDGDFRDSSGNGYHGLRIDTDNVPIGGGEFQPGRFGQALRMDGTAAVVAPLDLHWDTCPQVTIALWVRRNAQPASFSQLVSSGFGAGPKLGAHSSRLDVDGGSASGSARYSIEPGVWTPLVGTWDYEAGELTLHWPEGSLTEPFGSYTRPPQPEFWIGADGYLASLLYLADGVLIDDVRVWGRVLTADEIASVQAGNPPEVARCPCGPADGSGALPSPAPLQPGPSGGEEAPSPRLDPPPTLPQPGVIDPELTPPSGLPATPTPPLLPPGPSGDEEESTPLLDPPPTRPQPGVIDPELTPPDDLPEAPPSEYDPEPYLEQRREEYEQNFGPRDRAQVVIGSGFELAYAAVPEAFASSEGRIDTLDARLESWLTGGKKIRELFRIKGTEAIVAVADDGAVTVQGDARGKSGPVVNRIAEIRGRGRPIDLVADRGGDYVVLSGTNVYAHQAPPGAVAWAQRELTAGLQVTALALLSGDAWIGVSRRGVASGGMPAGYWGHELLEDVQRFVDAGEVVQDISAGAGSQSDKWAIATDKRVFVRGFDCRDYATFGNAIESDLPRQWDCEVLQRHCLANRATWDETDMGSDADPDVWQVNLLVTIGVENYDGEEKEEFDCWLEDALRRTELLFNDTPRVEFRLRTQRRTRVDGVDLPQFTMDSGGDYARFMDRNFDTMAKSKTEGYYQVLVVNDICIGFNRDDTRRCDIGGRATFPHVVDPLTRKHGIIMIYPDRRDWVLAHELGHYLGLIHTFQKQGSPGSVACNNPYVGNGLPFLACNSCQGIINSTAETCSSTYNAMDYCAGDNDDVRLNSCQRRRAANQRDRYQTSDGQTNYFKMKGRLGEPYCTEDVDCLADEYCNKGVAGVGRNVCKTKLGAGATCSRSRQCESGTCRLFKCR